MTPVWYPLLLEPHLSPKVWGGWRLARHLRKPLADGEPVGESWEAFDGSTVANGPLAGVQLGALLQRSALDVLGASLDGGAPFPLLFKFIDAQHDLSVQVHPDDEQARALEHYPYGKTEAWYILHADAGAQIVHGFRGAVDAQSVRRALPAGTLESLLAFVPVQRGDVVFVPAGTVHAIGRGIVLAEIQQQSDITYRLYDWNRKDSAGRPRELHIDKALQVVDFSPLMRHTIQPLPVRSESYDRNFLVACRFFAWERIDVRAPTPDLPLHGFELLSVIEGEVQLAPGVSAGLGQTALLPARMGSYRLTPERLPCTLLKAYVPDLRRDVVAPLRAAGYVDESIALLGGPDRSRNDIVGALVE